VTRRDQAVPLLLLGRMLCGVSYEVIDIMTIPLTSPYFQVSAQPYPTVPARDVAW
jgi:hypothetical protein